MRLRERANDTPEQEQQNPSSGTPTSDNLDALREAAERLLAAGDEAINRALSGSGLATAGWLQHHKAWHLALGLFDHPPKVGKDLF